MSSNTFARRCWHLLAVCLLVYRVGHSFVVVSAQSSVVGDGSAPSNLTAVGQNVTDADMASTDGSTTTTDYITSSLAVEIASTPLTNDGNSPDLSENQQERNFYDGNSTAQLQVVLQKILKKQTRDSEGVKEIRWTPCPYATRKNRVWPLQFYFLLK